jgi:hypothetical protein
MAGCVCYQVHGWRWDKGGDTGFGHTLTVQSFGLLEAISNPNSLSLHFEHLDASVITPRFNGAGRPETVQSAGGGLDETGRLPMALQLPRKEGCLASAFTGP